MPNYKQLLLASARPIQFNQIHFTSVFHPKLGLMDGNVLDHDQCHEISAWTPWGQEPLAYPFSLIKPHEDSICNPSSSCSHSKHQFPQDCGIAITAQIYDLKLTMRWAAAAIGR